MQILCTGTPTAANLNAAHDLTLSGANAYYNFTLEEVYYAYISIGLIAGGGNVAVTAQVRVGPSDDSVKRIIGDFPFTIVDGENPIGHTIGPFMLPYAVSTSDYVRVKITTDGGDDAITSFGKIILASDSVARSSTSEPVYLMGKICEGSGGTSANVSITDGNLDVNVVAYAGETATTNSTDNKPEVHAVDVDAIGGNTPIEAADISTACGTALNTAIPGSPTAESVNDLVKSADTAITNMPASILAATGITVGGTWTLAKLLKIIVAILAGKVRDKTGSTTIKEVLDAEDGTTVIAEIVISLTTAQRTLTVL